VRPPLSSREIKDLAKEKKNGSDVLQIAPPRFTVWGLARDDGHAAIDGAAIAQAQLAKHSRRCMPRQQRGLRRQCHRLRDMPRAGQRLEGPREAPLRLAL